MNVPSNPDFYLKLAISILIVGGTIFLQAQTGTVPEWLAVAFSSVVAFILGLSTQPNRH